MTLFCPYGRKPKEGLEARGLGESQQLAHGTTGAAVLKVKQTRFRMCKRKGTPSINIREIENGKVARQFSSGVYRSENDEDIAACAAQCIAASQGKGWEVTANVTVKSRLTWELLAQSALLPAEHEDLATDPYTGSVRRVVA